MYFETALGFALFFIGIGLYAHSLETIGSGVSIILGFVCGAAFVWSEERKNSRPTKEAAVGEASHTSHRDLEHF